MVHLINDVQHLLKNIRGGCFRYDVLLGDEIVEEKQLRTRRVRLKKYIRMIFDYDAGNVVKLHPGLSLKMFAGDHFDKMDVGLAKKIFCGQTVAALEGLLVLKVFTVEEADEARACAVFVRLVADWHDVAASRYQYNSLSRQDARK